MTASPLPAATAPTLPSGLPVEVPAEPDGCCDHCAPWRARAHGLAEEGARIRKDYAAKDNDHQTALSALHRAERRTDDWYVRALENELSVNRHDFRPGPGLPTGGSSCVATGCGRSESDNAHRTPTRIRGEASRRRNQF